MFKASVHCARDGSGADDRKSRVDSLRRDLEWIERLELWTDIEVVKVGYFAEGARELYEALQPIGLSDYIPYVAERELSESALRTNLAAIAA